MTTNYAKLLGRRSDAGLTPHRREVNRRIPPPQAELASMFGYDSNLHRLFHLEGGVIRYVDNTDYSVLIDGRSFAIWRVKSMLLFGNPDCIPPELKEFNPPNKPMAPIPPERK